MSVRDGWTDGRTDRWTDFTIAQPRFTTLPGQKLTQWIDALVCYNYNILKIDETLSSIYCYRRVNAAQLLHADRHDRRLMEVGGMQRWHYKWGRRQRVSGQICQRLVMCSNNVGALWELDDQRSISHCIVLITLKRIHGIGLVGFRFSELCSHSNVQQKANNTVLPRLTPQIGLLVNCLIDRTSYRLSQKLHL